MIHNPFFGLCLATLAFIGSLGLLAEPRNTFTKLGIAVCAAVMLSEGLALVADWRGLASRIRERLAAGRSQALAHMPRFVVRYVGLMLILVGIGGLLSGLRGRG